MRKKCKWVPNVKRIIKQLQKAQNSNIAGSAWWSRHHKKKKGKEDTQDWNREQWSTNYTNKLFNWKRNPICRLPNRFSKLMRCWSEFVWSSWHQIFHSTQIEVEEEHSYQETKYQFQRYSWKWLRKRDNKANIHHSTNTSQTFQK